MSRYLFPDAICTDSFMRLSANIHAVGQVQQGADPRFRHLTAGVMLWGWGTLNPRIVAESPRIGQYRRVRSWTAGRVCAIS